MPTPLKSSQKYKNNLKLLNKQSSNNTSMMINPCASSRKLFAVSSSLLLLVVFGYDNNRLIFSSAMNVAAATSTPIQVTECAIVGVGVLGTSLCKQLLRDPDFKDWKFTGITKSTKRHDEILKEVLGGDDDDQYSNRFELRTAVDEDSDDDNINDDDNIKNKDNKKFKHCVFCAPPSGFDDYPSAIRGAIDDLWMGHDDTGGSFTFTSSGGIYGSGGDSIDVASIVTESSLLPTNPIPRIERLINAEKEVLKEKGGSVLRLAGLYLLNRGAHNFWLGNTAEETKDEIAGRPDSLINLLHYEDAAGSVVAALKHNINSQQEQDDEEEGGEIFLISDGHPLTRQQICESSLKNKRYDDRTIPKFSGSKENGDLIGKVYDGSYTNKVLNWKPRYESFDTFMSS